MIDFLPACQCFAACNGHSAPSQGVARDFFGWPIVYSDTGTEASRIDFLLQELEDWRAKLWRTPEPDPFPPLVIDPPPFVSGHRAWMQPAVTASQRTKTRRSARLVGLSRA